MKQQKFDDLKASWKNCQGCPLKDSRSRVVFGHGNIDANIVLIGEAPGRNEDDGGKPFIGRAGELLTKICNALDLDREKDIWITNTCLCRPKNNRTPTKSEVKACSKRLGEELKIIQPDIVVLMGNTPLLAFTGKTGINKMRGWISKACHSNYPWSVYATFHPAALLYDPTKKPKAREDWKAIVGELNE